MFGTQRAGAVTKAMTFPACVCGHAYPSHVCKAKECECRTYQPNRAREYRLSHAVSPVRRWICEGLWSLERRCERWRVHFER